MTNWLGLASRGLLTAAILVLSVVAPAGAYQTSFLQRQPQQVANGRVTVLAATIFVLTCGNPNTTNENGAQYYLYEYVDAYGNTRRDIPPYRVISPPNWSQSIGGHDWANWQQAAAYACQKGVSGPTNTGPASTSNISGTWQLTSNCSWTEGGWKSTLMLNQGANGALTGSLTNDALKTAFATAETNWGSKVQNLYSPPIVTLLLHPAGWVSVLELTGTLSGSTISGRVHHYTSDDCTFSMSRA
jgi:hypothetical protein